MGVSFTKSFFFLACLHTIEGKTYMEQYLMEGSIIKVFKLLLAVNIG
jgi:hypothetical protein